MSDTINRLFREPIVGKSKPDEVFLAAVEQCLRTLVTRFPDYRRFLEHRSGGGFEGSISSVDDLDRLPAFFLPLLKQSPFPLPDDVRVAVTLTSSGTSGRPSQIPLDEENMNRRVAAMRSMYEAMGVVSGPTTAMAFLIDPATTQMAGSLVIDAVLKSLPQVQGIHYLATMKDSRPAFEPAEVARVLTTACESGPVLCVGYPSLMVAAMEALMASGIARLPLPEGSLVLTGGGWKSILPGVQIDQAEFREQAGQFFALPDSGIRDMYGMAECPAVMVQCPAGGYHVPVFTLAQAIDPETGEDVPEGETGLLQLTTPLTTCYPLLKLLTTDKIQIQRGCDCGLPAPTIVPQGRAAAARYETCAMKIGTALSPAS